ncbi:MAG: ACT domain-containing protein [Bryobacteraceae bacterium]
MFSSPTAMSPWKRAQLWRAYLAAHHELTRELDTERIHHAAGRPAFLEGFPTRYLRTHSAAAIAADTELADRSAEKGVALSLDHERGVYQLRMVTRDRPALFASVAGALAGFGMNILKAEAFSNKQGQVLDTFVFSDPIRTLELNPGEDERLLDVIERVVLGKMDLDRLLSGRPHPALPSRKAAVQPRVAFDQEASSHATLIEIVAQDRPGLLYDVARTLSEANCSIDIVLIDTEAHKALDVFYVTINGGKLPTDDEAALRESLLVALAG